MSRAPTAPRPLSSLLSLSVLFCLSCTHPYLSVVSRRGPATVPPLVLLLRVVSTTQRVCVGVGSYGRNSYLLQRVTSSCYAHAPMLEPAEQSSAKKTVKPLTKKKLEKYQAAAENRGARA